MEGFSFVTCFWHCWTKMPRFKFFGYWFNELFIIKLRWSRKTSARSSTSMALRSQLKPTRKSWISLTSPLTCLTTPTCPALNPATFYFTSTRSPTIHRRSLKISHFPSTNASLRPHMMKHPSTKLRRFTRKPLTTEDTNTTSSFQRLPLRNLLTLTEKTDTEILFGTTRPIAKLSAPT